MAVAQSDFTPTSVTLPPEGIEVLTKHFDFSNPVPLIREGSSWFHVMEGVKKGGKFKVYTNYQPVSWAQFQQTTKG